MTLKKSCHPKPAWAHPGWFFCCPLCKVRRHALAREKVNQEQESAIAAAIAAIQAELPRYGELDEEARALSALTRTLELQRGQLQRKSNELDEVKAGLELDVIDHYNGSIRSVKTLSGGKSFKASLSLALGLSDEIQVSAGGIRLDTMFVDEGFASLDEEPLQQAMTALSNLAESNRLVGIISHVAELRERIDKQIVVTKGKCGGSGAAILTP